MLKATQQLNCRPADVHIVEAMSQGDAGEFNLWDEEDAFCYDVLPTPNGQRPKLKVRTIVELIPLFAVEVLDEELLDAGPEFAQRLRWLLKHRRKEGAAAL